MKWWNELTGAEKDLAVRQLDETFCFSNYPDAATAAYNVRTGYENDPFFFAFAVSDFAAFESELTDLIRPYIRNPHTITGREDLGAYLRERRTEKGISVRGMAQAAGLVPSTVQNIENGAFTPRLDVILKISDVLGLSLTIG